MGCVNKTMGNSLKKWFFPVCLVLVLALFCLVWGCFFIPEQNSNRVVWELNPSAEEIYNLLSLEQSIRSNNLDEAKQSALLLVERDPSEETFVEAVSELMLKGEKSVSLEIAAKGHALYPESKRISLVYAEALMQSGRMEEGVALLSAYAEKNPYDTHIIMRLSDLLVRLKQFSKANEVLNFIPADAKPTELDPSFGAYADTPARKTPYYLYMKAKALLGLNKLKDAEALLKRAVEKDPKFVEAWAELAFLYEKSKRPAEALEIYNRLLELDRSNPSIWIRIVYSELQLGHVDNAFSAVELGPPTVNFLMQAGQLFTGFKEWNLAERIYLKAAALPGVDDEVFLYLFLVAYDGSKDLERAVNYLSMISPDSPLYERAVLYKIQALSENKRYSESMAVVEEALDHFPAQKSFWQTKASLYHVQGKYAEAEQLLDEALQRFPDDPELMFAKGALYDQLNRKAEAMQVMEAIVKAHPDNSAALNYIGYTLADKGVELERARELIERALAGDPENAHIIDSLAWVYFKMGNFAEAYKTILKAMEFSPQEAEIWEHYGDIAEKVNKPTEAKKAYARALELSSEDSAEIEEKLKKVRD